MLLHENEPLQSLILERIRSTEEQQIDSMGGRREYGILTSAGFIANCMRGPEDGDEQKKVRGRQSNLPGGQGGDGRRQERSRGDRRRRRGVHLQQRRADQLVLSKLRLPTPDDGDKFPRPTGGSRRAARGNLRERRLLPNRRFRQSGVDSGELVREAVSTTDHGPIADARLLCHGRVVQRHLFQLGFLRQALRLAAESLRMRRGGADSAVRCDVAVALHSRHLSRLLCRTPRTGSLRGWFAG
mmetsp:Transcript_52376/g.111294  ORF Transcript_52376/g.111294 Transcript_52376/m.111294 type:complete len:242 (+) Transcript_52376:236-961(+)